VYSGSIPDVASNISPPDATIRVACSDPIPALCTPSTHASADLDMTDYTHARTTMVDNQLRTSGITDRRLLRAMGDVARELFVPEVRRPLAYVDQPIALSASRKLGAPAPFAKLVQLAEISGKDHVLDLGCASGYSAAILSQLAASVVAVDVDGELVAKAKAALQQTGATNVTVVEGPFETAGKSKGPYDVIVLEGVVSAVPDALFAQLKPEGRIVALIASSGRPAVAHLFARSGKGIAASRTFDAALPPLPTVREDRFVF
jgi:protein-L-isoaspartate(D-aspartate) O-methyltransferase